MFTTHVFFLKDFLKIQYCKKKMNRKIIKCYIANKNKKSAL